MSKCETCKWKNAEGGWAVCDCCIHDPVLKDRFEPLTNANHILAMTDEELVDFLWQFNTDSFENVMPFCKNTEECGEKLDSADISTEMCKRCLLDKLRQPYKGETP